MIWKQKFSLEDLNRMLDNTLGSHLGIVFTAFGDDYLKAKMPVDKTTHQPHGILHGGASVALAETVGSVAANLCLEDLAKQSAVGLEINANHLKAAKTGFVEAIAKPIRIGRSIHVWEIDILNGDSMPICVSRLTMAVINNAV